MPLQIKFNRIYLIIAAVLIGLARMAGDFFIQIFLNPDNSIIIVWKFVTFALFSSSVLVFIFSQPIKELHQFEGNFEDDFFRDLVKLILLSLGLITGGLFIPERAFEHEVANNLFWLLISDVFTMYGIICGLIILHFVYKWLLIFKHKKTSTNIRILSFALGYFFIAFFIRDVLNLRENQVLSSLNKILFIIISVLLFFTAKKNSWIALLPRRGKLRLVGESLLGIIVSIIIFSYSRSDSGSLAKIFAVFLPGSSSILSIPILYVIIFYSRLFLSALASLPTSQIVERKTSELSSLAYLNRIISETIDFENLINTVTKLALQVSNAAASWAEFYDKKTGEVTVTSAQIISLELIKDIHKRYNISEFFKKIKKSELISSVTENKEIYYLAEQRIAGSLIVTPLCSVNDRFGTLVIVSPEEYGFEFDDIKIMAAFGDNVSVALENIRLVSEAVEKEHYKRELMLAQEIQKKLLPQEIPPIEKFSVSAFSIPSEEVGGDYYDILYIKDGRPCILIGDVSGKGITAAFYMAQLKGVVLSVAKEATGAADLLRRVNSTLYGAMEKQMYITMSSLVFDSADNSIIFARAGHMPTIIKSAKCTKLITPNGIGIGLAPQKIFDSHLDETRIKLYHGDVCLFFTDGINELKNIDGEEFGYEQLSEICENESSCNAKSFLDNLQIQLSEHVGTAHAHDDMTAVAIIFNDGEILENVS
ncbi:MAG: hypothetical protein HW421_2789 [Ignavibacteria bacterium]|nr:hypothetical protein [Ignavibacteria bacterium]